MFQYQAPHLIKNAALPAYGPYRMTSGSFQENGEAEGWSVMEQILHFMEHHYQKKPCDGRKFAYWKNLDPEYL